MEQQTPVANRIHIGFFGRCNAGKSTLINCLTGQDISIVSEEPGTTTDPVDKSMEILPLGPVVLIDTAGVDDTSKLGEVRIQRSKEKLRTSQIALYVLRTEEEPMQKDLEWLGMHKKLGIPTLVVLNSQATSKEELEVDANSYVGRVSALQALGFPYVALNAATSLGREQVLTALGALKAVDTEEIGLLDGIVEGGETIILVCPIDSAAPKGRLILPQVQMIREILDKKAYALVVQTEEIPGLLQMLKEPPDLVITDSQAFGEVNALLPKGIPLTSFSILMARFKGDLKQLVAGSRALHRLQDGAKVLISEGCTHHRQCDDIGTVKIPNWLKKAGFNQLELSWTSGGKFPENVQDYDLIIHCGGCMLTRREVLRRLEVASVEGVPVINYGVLIAYLHGILDRAIEPFEKELDGIV